MDKFELAEAKLRDIRVNLLINYPFFGVLSAKLILEPESNVTVMATDCIHLLYNPDFILSGYYNDSELETVYLHEVLHVVLSHPQRRKYYEPQMWNIACDFAVNSMIVLLSTKAVPLALPEEMLYDSRFLHNSAEEIYNFLLEDEDYLEDYITNAETEIELVLTSTSSEESESIFVQTTENSASQQEEDGSDVGQQEENDLSDATDNACTSEPATRDIDEDLCDNVANKFEVFQISHEFWDCELDNVVQSQSSEEIIEKLRTDKGITSAAFYCLEREILKNNAKSEIDWRSVLRDFLMYGLNGEEDFSPPDPNFYSLDMILPQEQFTCDNITNVYFFIDSSGSVDTKALEKCVSELLYCRDSLCINSEVFYGFFSDTTTEPLLLTEDVDITNAPTGGTTPESIFKKLKELDKLDEAVLIIILTDGYFNSIPEELAEDVPVLWLVLDHGTTYCLENWEFVVKLEES